MAEANYRTNFLSKEHKQELMAAGTNMSAATQLMNELFEATGEWQVDGNVIRGINTVNENLTLDEPVEAKEGEDWIGKLETSMKSTLRAMLPKALAARDTEGRFAWMEAYPFQILALVERIRWTSRVTAAIENSNLATLLTELKAENEELIMFLRGDATRELKDKSHYLLIYGSHYVYVVERLIGEAAYSSSNFTWRNQLKGYYDEQANQAYLQIHDMRQDYKYIYLGNKGVLIITELTEKMYAQAFECLESGKGYAPCGPAGTGKTETIKNLAKDLGRDCVVINCSDQQVAQDFQANLESSAQGDIFVCFDEFNRVTADQLEKLGAFLDVKAKCPWFITMNPGYEGRTELPAAINKHVLRISVIVPDLKLIYEMMLFSEGFKQGRSLGHKLAYFMVTAKDLFSPQKHYDWGLRSGKAMCKKAGLALRSKGCEITDDMEHQVFVSALDSHVRKLLLTSDLARYEPFVAQLFHGLQADSIADPELEDAVKNALQSQGFKFERQTKVANHLNHDMKIRHGVALLGAADCGKKTILNALGKALETMGQNLTKIEVDADAATNEELYNPDGLITNAIRQSTEAENPTWIIIKGGANSEKIENMNTVLDDNKKLCLETGEMYDLGTKVRIVYLFESAENLSPATISRLGIVYVNEEDADFN